MRALIRTDASLIIGHGHVMRCLTLASALRDQDSEAFFVCREHDGHLCGFIEDQGFSVHRLTALKAAPPIEDVPAHAAWLGASWQEDSEQTCAAIESSGAQPDWLVIDHYALDQRWEMALRASVGRIMVIDDLADRVHDCNVLLDQNYHPDMDTRYERLIPTTCESLFGPRYALLRPEFRHARRSPRKRDGKIKRILVFFGGSDLTNETAKVINAIGMLDKRSIEVDVVVGGSNRNRSEFVCICEETPNFNLHNSVTNMAELMERADLFVGAGGATTWERCAMGLPAVTVAVANNQVEITKSVAAMGAAKYIGEHCHVTVEDFKQAIDWALSNPRLLVRMSNTAMKLSDAKGTDRVVRKMMGIG
jgi:UDP-2,4-diacetamido-2,4,6-trideoxy-beta-L-altropyranose hydrolase